MSGGGGVIVKLTSNSSKLWEGAFPLKNWSWKSSWLFFQKWKRDMRPWESLVKARHQNSFEIFRVWEQDEWEAIHMMQKYFNDTLQGTNISHLRKRKIIFKCGLVGDFWVPRRVSEFGCFERYIRWHHRNHHWHKQQRLSAKGELVVA